MRKGRRKQGDYGPKININEGIRATELRVLFGDGKSEIMSKKEAIARANTLGLDLIEISASATPVIAKITDYGKFQYEQKKKRKEIKAKARENAVGIKSIQVKVGTGDADIAMKAARASGWLRDGQRVKIELFLRGRVKYLDKKFLHARLHKVLPLLTEEYTIVEDIKTSPKGIMILVEAKNKGGKKVPKASTGGGDIVEKTKGEE